MEVIIIDIEIKKRNHLREFERNLHSKLEDLLFYTVTKLPENLIPTPVMNWMEQYTNKRITELNQQVIRDRWQLMELDKAVAHISNRQQDIEKAPSEE